ncbi:MAG: hypothetical protein HUK40_20545 [Desulfobacter sp.]|nr:hypothetical protein [Desulfobacter sp.]WDP86600.1 MAG: hypothetical protein HUN05_16950 [Desulfobacter sp.]
MENVDEVVFIPTNTLVLRSFAPADPDFTADLLWLRTAYYFGSHAVTDQDYFYLYYLLNKITDLAPGWEYPYHFGGIVLLLEADMPVQALKLTNKGLAFHKTSWELYFMKGYILWKAFNNYKGAAEQIFKASEIRGSPDYFAPLSVTLAQKTGDDIFTASFAQFVMNSLKDENQKKIIQKKMSGQSNQ